LLPILSWLAYITIGYMDILPVLLSSMSIFISKQKKVSNLKHDDVACHSFFLSAPLFDG
jgi:hypothetical protein